MTEIEGFVFCGDYGNRPAQCRNHEFPAHVCPIGWDVLGLRHSEDMRLRVDRGWEITKQLEGMMKYRGVQCEYKTVHADTPEGLHAEAQRQFPGRNILDIVSFHTNETRPQPYSAGVYLEVENKRQTLVEG